MYAILIRQGVSVSLCSYGHDTQWKGQQPCLKMIDSLGMCYWHRPGKRHFDPLAKALKVLVSENETLHGLNLQEADLTEFAAENLDPNRPAPDFRGSNFKRALLRKSHLYKCNLENCTLIKADLRDANLNFANLKNANLLGVKLDGAHLEHVNWGERVLQENQGLEALQKKRKKEAKEMFAEAEEVYRLLRTEFQNRGLFETSSKFFYREMIMRRYQYPILSRKRFFSKVSDLISGYSEKPYRVIWSSLVVIYLYSICYFLFGLKNAGEKIGFFDGGDVIDGLLAYTESLYFSAVSFSTKGYGLLEPIGWSRAFAVSEAFVGAFWMALFVAVFVRKRSR